MWVFVLNVHIHSSAAPWKQRQRLSWQAPPWNLPHLSKSTRHSVSEDPCIYCRGARGAPNLPSEFELQCPRAINCDSAAAKCTYSHVLGVLTVTSILYIATSRIPGATIATIQTRRNDSATLHVVAERTQPTLAPHEASGPHLSGAIHSRF